MNIKQILKKIKLIILDVDGVLTDGKIIITNDGNEIKNFNIKDGLGIILLQKIGIKISIITGKSSCIVNDRFLKLGIQEIFQGQYNKSKIFNILKKKHKLLKEEIAYIGDDLPDLSPIKKSGFSFCPKNSEKQIKKNVNYICKNFGGEGVIREVCNIILISKDVFPKILNNYKKLGEVVFT